MSASILIADDYEDNRELLRLILESAGYRVSEARDGRECVERAQREHPALALIDLSMPVMDGWTTLRELRADERTRALPCIAITAFSDEDRARAAGFDGYISKPYNSKELLDMIGRLLNPTPTGNAVLD